MFCMDKQVAMLNLRIFERLANVVQASMNGVRLLQHLDPFLHRTLREDVVEHDGYLIAVIHSRIPRGEAPILEKIGSTDRTGKVLEMGVLRGGNLKLPVCTGDCLRRHAAWTFGPDPAGDLAAHQIAEEFSAHGRDLAVEKRDIDMLADAVLGVATVESTKNSRGRRQRSVHIGNQIADALRLAVWLAGHAHHTALRLEHTVVAGPGRIWATLPISGDGAIDDTGIDRADWLVIESVALEVADLVVLDKNVRIHAKLLEKLLSPRVRDVQRQRFLVAVRRQEQVAVDGVSAAIILQSRPQVPGFVATPRSLDLDDVRTHVGQHLRTERGSDRTAQFEYPDPLKRFRRIDLMHTYIPHGTRIISISNICFKDTQVRVPRHEALLQSAWEEQMRVLKRLLLAVAIGFASVPAYAQSFPNRQITIVVPFAPGGTMDGVGRAVGDALNKRLKVPVVVENKAGASGLIGFETLQNAPADGYTVGLIPLTTFIAFNYTHRPMPDFTKLGLIAKVYTSAGSPILVVNPKTVPVKTLDELIAYMKEHPDTSYTSVGVGSLGHLALAGLFDRLGIKATHIPYKGGAPATMEVVAGTVGVMAADLTAALPHIQAGSLRPIAVMAKTKSDMFKDVPTLAELGYGDLAIDAFGGLIVPPNTPEVVKARLSQELAALLAEPSVQEYILRIGNVVDFRPSDELRKLFEEETTRWTKVIEENKIVVE
jgi:tripartite-type tricarboxylate transporter receptor subunit TctC